jgi:hypothetical protein
MLCCCEAVIRDLGFVIRNSEGDLLRSQFPRARFPRASQQPQAGHPESRTLYNSRRLVITVARGARH